MRHSLSLEIEVKYRVGASCFYKLGVVQNRSPLCSTLQAVQYIIEQYTSHQQPPRFSTTRLYLRLSTAAEVVTVIRKD